MPLREIWRRRHPLTERDAEASAPPPAFRGFPALDAARCAGDAACAAACPTGAIDVAHHDDGWRWSLDRAACVTCGLCVDACPGAALAPTLDDEAASRTRRDLTVEVEVRPGGPTPAARAPAAEIDPAEETDAFRAAVARLFRSSLHVRHLDVGSDNAPDWELSALLGPIYDLQRLGIDFVASPRHADMLVVTGAVTRNLYPALRMTYDATPEPKLVVAVGADACSGGITRGSYATLGGVDRHIPVDVYVPGDPPRPRAILHGLLLALGRREQKVRHGRG